MKLTTKGMYEKRRNLDTGEYEYYIDDKEVSLNRIFQEQDKVIASWIVLVGGGAIIAGIVFLVYLLVS